MWGYEYDEATADEHDRARLRKWWNATFKGLHASKIGKRVVVHGQDLAEHVRYTSLPIGNRAGKE